MGSVSYPTAIVTALNSTQLPVNAASVLADGQLVSSNVKSLNITSNTGGIAYFTAGLNNATFTVSGINYAVTSGTIAPLTIPSGLSTVVVTSNFSTVIPPTTWTSSTLLPSGAIFSSWSGLTFGANTFVAVNGYGNASNIAGYSLDSGRTWLASTMPVVAQWSSVSYAASTFAAVAYISGSSSTNIAAYSPNGYTWSLSTLPANAYWRSVAGATTGYFIAISDGNGSATQQAAYSTNGGITWNSSTLPTITACWASVAYGNVNWVAIAGNFSSLNYAAYSANNGTSWTASTLPASLAWKQVAYGFPSQTPTFVAVANATSTGAYSTNGGASWSSSTMPYSANWQSITYGNGYFVALAYGSTSAAYSNNGYTWTGFLTGTGNFYYQLAYGNGTFETFNSTVSGVNYSVQAGILPVEFGIYSGPSKTY